MVEKQYPQESYELKTHSVVKFVESDGSESIGIEVLNVDQLKRDGWNWYFENESVDAKVCNI